MYKQMKINIDRHDIKWDDDVRISIKSQSKKIRILRIIYHIYILPFVLL